ncbi:hypothetical protein JL720_15071 [Aureococcus anophagefferens]|nr:hypothetical protein JL720_15071 [Aureococcus anophagefferens]
MAGPARNLDFGDTPTRDAPAGHAALDATNAEHNSPLHLLARSGNVEGVGLLLQHGADPNLRGAGGCSPLHAVCDAPLDGADEQHARCVAALLAAGADGDVRDDAGRSPLLAAVERGRLACVACLVERGADFGGDADGRTPLHAAAAASPEALALLLAAPGDRRPGGALPASPSTPGGTSAAVAIYEKIRRRGVEGIRKADEPRSPTKAALTPPRGITIPDPPTLSPSDDGDDGAAYEPYGATSDRWPVDERGEAVYVAPPADAWVECWTDAGERCYYCPATQASEWELPAGAALDATSPMAPIPRPPRPRPRAPAVAPGPPRGGARRARLLEVLAGASPRGFRDPAPLGRRGCSGSRNPLYVSSPTASSPLYASRRASPRTPSPHKASPGSADLRDLSADVLLDMDRYRARLSPRRPRRRRRRARRPSPPRARPRGPARGLRAPPRSGPPWARRSPRGVRNNFSSVYYDAGQTTDATPAAATRPPIAARRAPGRRQSAGPVAREDAGEAADGRGRGAEEDEGPDAPAREALAARDEAEPPRGPPWVQREGEAVDEVRETRRRAREERAERARVAARHADAEEAAVVAAAADADVAGPAVVHVVARGRHAPQTTQASRAADPQAPQGAARVARPAPHGGTTPGSRAAQRQTHQAVAAAAAWPVTRSRGSTARRDARAAGAMHTSAKTTRRASTARQKSAGSGTSATRATSRQA